MLGTRAHAAEAVDFYFGARLLDYDADPPEGFKNLSPEARYGCGRLALLHTDTDVVYKVDNTRSRSCLGNEQEYVVARYLHRIYRDGVVAANVRLPKVGLFTFANPASGEPLPVVSMQFVKGEQGGESPDVTARRALRDIGLSDMHGGNYICDDEGVLWPIDLGSNLSAALHPDFKSPYGSW